MSDYEEKTIRLMIQEGGRLLSEVERMQDENRRLREERDHWHVEQVHAYSNWEDAYRRAAELESENAKLREERDTYRDLVGMMDHPDVNAQLQAENDKLRERVHELEIEYDGATTAVLEKTERIEWIAGRLRGETNENDRLRELVRCLVNAEHPSDRATLIANAADMLAELGVEVDE